MPVEIKELIIRAAVDTGVVRSPGEPSSDVSRVARPLDQPSAEALVEACVKQVLRVLERRDER